MSKILTVAGIFLSGILGAFIHPTVLFSDAPFQWGFLAWIHLVFLFLIIRRKPAKRVFAYGFISFLITFSVSLYWVVPAMKIFGGLQSSHAVVIHLLMVVILALFLSAGLTAGEAARRRLPRWGFFALPVFVTYLDFFRSTIPFGGFPWPMVAYSQADFLSFFQWIDTVGVFGLSLFIYLVNSLIAEGIFCRKIKYFVLVACLFGLSFLASAVSDARFQRHQSHHPFHRVALVQGNISQDVKWDTTMAENHLANYALLTSEAYARGATMVIWSESAYPYTMDLDLRDDLTAFAEEITLRPLLTGAVTQQIDPETGLLVYHNSALMIENGKEELAVYHKRQLVPYGEYVPFKKWFTLADRLTEAVGDFSAGVSGEPLINGPLSAGLLICYEDLFGRLSRQNILGGANVLINLTNDAWYGRTSAMYQHAVFSRFRALEFRRFLVRATNTGITAAYDAYGSLIGSLPPFSRDFLMVDIQPINFITPYARFGDVIGYFCWVVSILLIGSFLRCP